MKKALLLALAVLTMLLFASGAALAQQVTVTGVGISKDDAVRDALRNAVEQAVGTLVDSETLVQNMAVVNDEIYTKSQGFVRDFDVLNSQVSGGQYTVTVRATIDTEPNSELMTKLQKLKLIEKVLRDPKIGVIIAEYNKYYWIPNQAAESAVVRKLREAGFKRVIDPRQAENIRGNDFIKAVLDGDTAAAKAIATTYSLDYVVVGSAFSNFAGEVVAGGGVLSARASIEAKVMKVDTGEIVASNTFEAAGVDITRDIAAKKALAKAGEKVADYLIKELLNYAADTEKPLRIVVTRIPSFTKLNALQSELKATQGVKAVYLRNYKSGMAEIDINYVGAPQNLANQLQNFSNVTLTVTNVSNSALDVEMR